MGRKPLSSALISRSIKKTFTLRTGIEENYLATIILVGSLTPLSSDSQRQGGTGGKMQACGQIEYTDFYALYVPFWILRHPSTSDIAYGAIFSYIFVTVLYFL